MKPKNTWAQRRKRIYTIIDIGTTGDYISRGYDFLYTLAILVNLTASILYTYEHLATAYGSLLLLTEYITAAYFTVDYFLRLWTARYLYPDVSPKRAVLKYALSFAGLVDILSFLPYYLPFFFPQGAMAFRIIRIVRILRLFRITAYYDSLHVIKAVLSSKSQQLISSTLMIFVLMLASSLCMYSLEHEAQPDVFENAFSGIWWAVSALLTVGYGDIYPITALGKLFGIFLTLCIASVCGFKLNDAASIAIIGAADGPTAIYVANMLKSSYTAAIMVAAYSYMALVPIVQPPIIKLCTTKKERLIRMDNTVKVKVSKSTEIMFPILVTIIVGLVAPDAVALIGFLMFGNLIRVCGVLDSLSETAQKVLANLITIFLGITIASRMGADEFLQFETMLIMGMGLLAFVFDTFGGIMLAKIMNLFSKTKINPMIGAAGISAFPMSSRVVHKMGLAEDPTNFLLMHSVAVNVSGQIASVIAGGLILALVK